MIVIDTSALMAILLREPEAPAITRALAEADEVVIGAPTLFELRLAMFRRKGETSIAEIEELLGGLPMRVITFDDGLIPLAFDGLTRFGRAPAWLNYGDCLCYAVAKALDAPLLYKGLDFAATDLSAVPFGA